VRLTAFGANRKLPISLPSFRLAPFPDLHAWSRRRRLRRNATAMNGSSGS
jgi:hypothetical protein